MYNVHTHAWDAELHLAPATRAETDRCRGRPLDLSLHFDSFLKEELAPFAKTIVFAAKARLTGYSVPDEYISEIVRRAPNKLLGFAARDPTQDNALAELRHGIEDLALVGIEMMPMYASFDPRDPRCTPSHHGAGSKGCVERKCFEYTVG